MARIIGGMALCALASLAGGAASAQPAPRPECEPGERGSPTERLGCTDSDAVVEAAAKSHLRGPERVLLAATDGVPGVTLRIAVGMDQVTRPNRYGGRDDLPLDATWAEAARIAARQCKSRGLPAGHFNGHADRYDSIYIICSVKGVVWRDARWSEIVGTEWGFRDINTVSWAKANRAAERLCAKANRGYSGGHFNGHQLDDKYGLFCYGEGTQWFDATDAELAATGWGFATPRLDDVDWDQAMRAATGFCIGKGFDGGFMNGHQAPNRYGVVCQR